MSLYAKALVFMGWTLCVLLTFTTWMPYLSRALGQAGTILGLGIWLAHGAVAMWLFRCPACGTSMFQSGKGGMVVRSPWPRRICGNCGCDLTRTRIRP